MENKIEKIHEQIENLFSSHGVETFVSVKDPSGRVYEFATAKKGTLKDIKKSLEAKTE